MQLAPILILVALICAAVGLCVHLFVSLKRELHRLEKRAKDSDKDSLGRVETLRREIAEVRKELDSMPGFAPPIHSGAGINLNRRTQALRMIRMGEGPEQIAATLSLPKNEVVLLIKVQKLLLESGG